MRPEQIIFKALEYASNDRYLLTLAVAKRVNQILAGDKIRVKDEFGNEYDPNKHKVSDLALLEIAQGKIEITTS